MFSKETEKITKIAKYSIKEIATESERNRKFDGKREQRAKSQIDINNLNNRKKQEVKVK